MKAHGNVVDHEYEIERDGETVATISKKWFRVRDSYGVDVAAGEDVAAHPRDHRRHDALTTRSATTTSTSRRSSARAPSSTWVRRPPRTSPGSTRRSPR